MFEFFIEVLLIKFFLRLTVWMTLLPFTLTLSMLRVIFRRPRVRINVY